MTAPDSFATSDDAAAYGYTLPDATAAGLLARATQAIRDEAGMPITPPTTSTLEVTARCGLLELPTALVTSVSGISLLSDDSDPVPVTDWRFERSLRVIHLGRTLTWAQRNRGRFAVTYVHGLAVMPPGLVLLTASVAARLSVTPAAAEGLKSKTVGSVSWTAGDSPSSALSASECCKLARIVPLRRVWQVPI